MKDNKTHWIKCYIKIKKYVKITSKCKIIIIKNTFWEYKKTENKISYILIVYLSFNYVIFNNTEHNNDAI